MALSWWFASAGSSDVVSVQYGSIAINQPATSATATITSVDTTQSIVLPVGQGTDNASGSWRMESWMDLTLTNATTVTAGRGTGGTDSGTIQFMVITFTGVKSLQDVRTTDPGDSGNNNTTTITSVNTAKTCIFLKSPAPFDVQSPNFPTTIGGSISRIVLTNATTLTQTRQQVPATGRNRCKLYVVEFN